MYTSSGTFQMAMWFTAIVAVSQLPAAETVFHLNSGGEIRGQLLNPDELPRTGYRIQRAEGGVVLVAPGQVRRIQHVRDAIAQYEQVAPTYANTVEAQWALAEWCRQNHLLSQRRAHLTRITQLDPEHKKAHYGLGLVKVEGAWVSKKEERRQKGLHYYRGRWRLAQEIELIEERKRTELAEKHWLQQLTIWRETLSDSPRKALRARDQILSIRDVRALPALRTMISRERHRSVKMLYLKTFALLPEGAGVPSLVELSLLDADEEIRYSCVEYVIKLRHKGVLENYVKALKNSNNHIVNRAAWALGELDDDSVVAPLIDALITRHVFTHRSGGSPETVTTTFNTGPNNGLGPPGGLSMGSRKKTYVRHVENQEVLQALVKLTGTNYSYNQVAWQQWHAANEQAELVQAARDDAEPM